MSMDNATAPQLPKLAFRTEVICSGRGFQGVVKVCVSGKCVKTVYMPFARHLRGQAQRDAMVYVALVKQKTKGVLYERQARSCI